MTIPEKSALLFVECQRGVVGDLSVLPALAEAAAPVLADLGRLAEGARAGRCAGGAPDLLPLGERALH